MTDFFSAVSNFGFPVAVAAYLLFRFENKFEKFAEKIDKFSEVIEGKPSEGKKGLIGVIEKNNEITERLIKSYGRISKKKK